MRCRRSRLTPAVDPDRPHDLFANNMRQLRKVRALSREALAGPCDLDRTYISGIERMRRNLSIRNIQRIADALEVRAGMLLDLALDKNRMRPANPY